MQVRLLCTGVFRQVENMPKFSKKKGQGRIVECYFCHAVWEHRGAFPSLSRRMSCPKCHATLSQREIVYWQAIRISGLESFESMVRKSLLHDSQKYRGKGFHE